VAKAAVNKSQAIREYYSQHRRAKPREVVAALAAKGIEVSPQTVSTIRYSMRLKKGRKKGRRGARRAAAAAPARRATANGRGAKLFTALVDAKKLADRLGGIDRARQALNMLEQLS
jgi:hypothetical protein